MNPKYLIGIVIAGGALAVYLLSEAPAPDGAATGRSANANRTTPSLAGQRGVEALAPSSRLVNPAAARSTPAAAPRATLSNEFAATRQLKALYDRLANSAEGRTPEGQYTLYRILRACANVTDRRGPRPLRVPTDEERQAYLAALSDRDPAKVKRVAAYEQLSEDRCVGLSGIVTTEAELGQRLRDAAAAGSPAARTAQIEQEMWQERRTSQSRGPTLNDAQIEAIKAALASRDPEAMVTAARIFANTFRDLSVRIGPDQLNAENRALMNALAVTACDYGYACADNNLRILNACAHQGHCEAGNLPDFIQYYNTSPYDAQLLQQYRAVIHNAIETGDWSNVAFVRGPTNPSASRFRMAPGPR